MGQKRCWCVTYRKDVGPSNTGLPGPGLPNQFLISCRQILNIHACLNECASRQDSELTFLAAGDEAAGLVLARPMAVLNPQQHPGKVVGTAQQRNIKPIWHSSDAEAASVEAFRQRPSLLLHGSGRANPGEDWHQVLKICHKRGERGQAEGQGAAQEKSQASQAGQTPQEPGGSATHSLSLARLLNSCTVASHSWCICQPSGP